MDENMTDTVGTEAPDTSGEEPAGDMQDIPMPEAAPEEVPDRQSDPQQDERETENAALRQALAESELREQDAAMLADSSLGQAYALIREDTLGLVRRCREQGLYRVDVNAAFCALLETHAAEIIRAVRENAGRDALQHARDNSRATPGRLDGGAEAPAHSYGTMGSGEFAHYAALARAGKLRRTN